MTLKETRLSQLSAAKRTLLEKRLKGRDATPPPPPGQLIQRRVSDSSAPLSFAQQRLWFLWQMTPDSFAYNVPAAFHLKGQLDLSALERSFNEIIRRHEALRTSFQVVNAQPRQVISTELVLHIPLEDLQHLPEDARRPEAIRQAGRDARQPFDLEQLPLLRARVLRLAPDEHVLLVVMHHIVTDGWSLGVLVRELGALYQAYLEGQESPLTDLEVQYADYAQWQRSWLTGEVLERELAYWRKQLSGSNFVLELPTDRARPPVQGQRGVHLPFAFSAETTRKLEELSRASGVTLFMTLLAGFGVLLNRYTGQSEIILGTPIANRTRAEVKDLIGFFVNTLALKINLSGAPVFRELLNRVGEMTTAAYAHQDVPFERLVEELQPERDLSRSPLFQVMFALLNMPTQSFELPGLSLSPLDFEHGATGFDLECHLWDDGQRLRGLVVYSTDLFEEATVRRLIGHFVTLLEGACAHPDERIKHLPLLTPAEEHQLLFEWNNTVTGPHLTGCVHQLFSEQVARTPDHVAVRFGDATLTYSELNRRANRLARHLRSKGVAAESIVGLCLERSMEMIVCVLGVLKAGGAYLPLDPSYPPERLAFMMDDARASLLLTQESLRDYFSDAGTATEIICLEQAVEDLSPEKSQTPPLETTTSENLAYVIYTSGSTGMPKGVMMPHRALVNLLRYQIERSARVCPAPRTLQFASLGFDVSFQEIFSTLCTGGELVLVGEDERRDGGALLRLLRASRVERLFLPFVALQHLAETSEREALLPASLREVITAGEQLKVTPYLKSMFEKLKGCVLDNQYGPSECHVVSAFRLDGEAARWPELPPIGNAIANAQHYALDEEMQLVPVGVTGELFIGGDCLSRGYLAHADVTAEKFIPHPFPNHPGARLYRTGDLVRRLPDGNLEFLGRLDSQVKVRGYRIEPGEVESALSSHPSISEGVVLVHTDGAGEKRLVAFVVATVPEELKDEELRQFLRRKLPDYMVPSAFVRLDHFPLTPSGKVNRLALHVPETLQFERGTAYVAPHTTTQKMLADIWAEVLDLKRVGIDDNFFELGGHSLLATRVLSRTRSTFQVELTLRQLFEQPTIKRLAQYIEEKAPAQEKGTKVPPPISARPAGELPPLSFAQQRLWFIDQLFPQSPAYNLPTVLRLEGQLDIAALKRSFNEIIRRHETLRTTFKQANERVSQVIAREMLLDIPLRDLRTLPTAQREAETLRLASEEAQRPFDLQHGPLLRAQLLRLQEREHVLLLTMHHIVTDGWSLGVLVRELGTLYQAYLEGLESPLTDLEVQYADYAVWQREWMSGEALSEQLEYWRKQLSGSNFVLELPTDRARPPVQSQHGAQIPLVLTETITQKLNELSRSEGVTLFMTLLAAFQILLSRYAGQSEIIVGSPIANRTRLETEPLIGFFVNTLVLRTDLAGQPSFRELVQRVKEVTLGAYAHQDVPFERLVEELQPERDLSRSPLFQVMFMLQNAPIGTLEMPGLQLGPVPIESAVEMFDLTLSLSETDRDIRGALSYNTDLFDEATAQRMCGHFEMLLEGIVTGPGRHVSELPLLTEGERRQLLREWNDTRFELSGERLLQRMFEAQVERTPERTALVYEESQVTWGELDRRANRLANYLARLGVGPEKIVAVMMERSLELVISLLGVLKAGGAYLPLDPEYPPERLAFMLEDSRAEVLLTEAEMRDRLRRTKATVICPDEDWETMAAESDEPPMRVMSADNPAYVIYTSGSTGRPKGVLISHAAICNRLSWGAQVFPLDESDRILQSTTISFDVSVWELFAPLVNGAKLVLARPGGHREIAYLIELMKREKITIINVVPSLLQVLLEDERFRQCHGLRQVFVGGEAMPPDLPARFFSQSSAELYNFYGPTETTIDATYWRCVREDAPRRGVPIGRPIGNMQVYLFDQYLQPVPVGVAGELCIGGAGLARGYLGRPDLTAEKFIPHPYGERAGARLYRTGDVARYLPDGRLEFLRRVDDQVKIHGFRIETGEIEAALLKHTSVKNALVRVSKIGAGQNLLASVVRDGQLQLSEALLSAFDQKRLEEIVEEIEMLPESETDFATKRREG